MKEDNNINKELTLSFSEENVTIYITNTYTGEASTYLLSLELYEQLREHIIKDLPMQRGELQLLHTRLQQVQSPYQILKPL